MEKFNKIASVTMHCSTGVYIGDPCYVLDDDLYHQLIHENHGDVLMGSGVICHSTKYGDGCYCATVNERLYGVLGVDSGLIGVVNLDACTDGNPSLDGHVILCPGRIDVELEYNDAAGVITFLIKKPYSDNITIEINTGALHND